MFALFIIRFFKDSLTLKISGAHPERFIDICRANDVGIQQIKRVDNNLRVCIARSDFKRLYKPLHRSGIRVRVIKKRGIKNFARKNKNKVSAVVAAVVFGSLLAVLSTRIWVIDVIGNQSFSDGEILSLCEDLGVKTGIKRTDINSAYLKNRLLSKTDRLGFISFNVIGSRLEIEVSETKAPLKSDKSPCNLIATEDGVVKSLKIYDGTPLVKVGDGVKKGDLLVSGIRKREDGVENFVCAYGEVICTVEKTVTESTPLSYTQNRRENNYLSQNFLYFFGISLPLGASPKSGRFETQTQTNNLTVNNLKLPVAITQKRFYKITPTVVNLTEDTAKKLLEQRVLDRYINDGKIISTKDDFYKNNGVCVLKRTVIMEINAVKSQPISIAND